MLILLSLLTSLMFSNILVNEDVSKNKDGIKLFEEKKYEEAAKAFSALKDQKNKDISNFNTGDSYYKKGEYDKAEGYFYNSLRSNDPKTQVESFFNLGNTKFSQKDVKAALNAYQSALDLCKSSAKEIGEDYCKKIADEIRNNMQYVFNLKKQKDEEKKQEDQKKNKEQKEKEDKNKEEKKEGNKDKEQQKKEGNKEQKMNISPQQAKQLLNIIDSNDSNLQKKLLKEKQVPSSNNGKDW